MYSIEDMEVNLVVPSVEETVDWYGEVLGWEGEEYVVIVEDDGKGILDEVKERIFDRGFKEGENAGSGLGMYLVKDIVESYGGSVKVEDSEFGGARFEIKLQRPR